MSNRKNEILDILKTGPASARTIGYTLNAPAASIRRTIQELRHDFTINDARDNNGLYRLVQA